ncbi:hypothetical protein ACIQUQ_17815 [Streptomyces sp. NPDC101118]|uniref:hypothetical protein n=1 Tax=Streptomyces sp. NPDC101118 TaxID=3366109 RepID=UPI003811B101
MTEYRPEPEAPSAAPGTAEPLAGTAVPVPAGAGAELAAAVAAGAEDTVPDPAGPGPLGVERTPTGRPEVDAALDRLADADHLPAEGHVAVYEDVHRELRDALTALDAHPAPGPYEHRS